MVRTRIRVGVSQHILTMLIASIGWWEHETPGYIGEDDHAKEDVELEKSHVVEDDGHRRGPIDMSLLPNLQGHVAF